MRKKPELVSVSMIVWDLNRSLYGLVTVFDDGYSHREPWGNYDETFHMLKLRSRDIAGTLIPGRTRSL